MDFFGDDMAATVASVVVAGSFIVASCRPRLALLAGSNISPLWSRLLAMASGAGVIILSCIYGGLNEGLAQGNAIGGIILLQGATVGLPLLQQRTTAEAIAAAVGRFSRPMARDVQMLSTQLKNFSEATGHNKKVWQGKLTTLILVDASVWLGGRETRVTYYIVQKAAPARRLVPSPGTSHGRADPAKYVFDEQNSDGSPNLLGKTVFSALDAGSTTYCSNIDIDTPDGWNLARPTVWKSFISVPVIQKGTLLGMLTVDSTQVEAFDNEVDIPLARGLADLLATVL